MNPIEIYQKIHENSYALIDKSQFYYDISIATYNAWISPEAISLENELAKRLVNLVNAYILGDIEDSYSDTKHNENRLEYEDFKKRKVEYFKKIYKENPLIQEVLINI